MRPRAARLPAESVTATSSAVQVVFGGTNTRSARLLAPASETGAVDVIFAGAPGADQFSAIALLPESFSRSHHPKCGDLPVASSPRHALAGSGSAQHTRPPVTLTEPSGTRPPVRRAPTACVRT